MSVATPATKIDPQTRAVRRSVRADRIVRWSLRLFGSVDLLALIAVVMPVAWMRAAHVACGLGEFSDGPLPIYLARSTSLLYVFHGAMLWCLSTDVTRYRPVIRLFGRVTVVFGLVLVMVDLSAGMPQWWTWTEGPVFAATGLWLLWWSSQQMASTAQDEQEHAVDRAQVPESDWDDDKSVRADNQFGVGQVLK